MDLGAVAVAFAVPTIGAVAWVGAIANRVKVAESRLTDLSGDLKAARADVETRLTCAKAEQVASAKEVLAAVESVRGAVARIELHVQHLADVKANRDDVSKCTSQDCPRLPRHDAE